MFRVASEGQYGEDEGQVTLYDGDEELCTWTNDEWEVEPSLVFVIAEAIRVGYTDGADEIRRRLA